MLGLAKHHASVALHLFEECANGAINHRVSNLNCEWGEKRWGSLFHLNTFKLHLKECKGELYCPAGSPWFALGYHSPCLCTVRISCTWPKLWRNLLSEESTVEKEMALLQGFTLCNHVSEHIDWWDVPRPLPSVVNKTSLPVYLYGPRSQDYLEGTWSSHPVSHFKCFTQREDTLHCSAFSNSSVHLTWLGSNFILKKSIFPCIN